MAVDKLLAATKLSTENLGGVHTSPVSTHAKGLQVAFTPHHRTTQTTREEPESVGAEYAKLTAEERLRLKQLHIEVQEKDKRITRASLKNKAIRSKFKFRCC